MTTDVTMPRTRRAVLAGVGGAVAALIAQAIGRPLGARAEGETVTVGGDFATATSRTSLRNRANDADVLVVRSDGRGTALHAISPHGFAIEGSTDDQVAVRGRAESGVGVQGASTFGWGVLGGSWMSSGVYGESEGGVGVEGVGIEAATGVLARSRLGVALRTRGRIELDVSGVATIPAGANGRTVSPGVSVVPGAFVLLTPRANIGARSLWYTTDPGADTFRIHIAPTRPAPTPVAWLLLG